MSLIDLTETFIITPLVGLIMGPTTTFKVLVVVLLRRLRHLSLLTTLSVSVQYGTGSPMSGDDHDQM